ncbi:MAG: RNA-binding S4 domain-containing protein [Salaquimonas sp.]
MDKWLWFARQTKTRSLAQKLVTGGNVRLNRDKINSAAKLISIGDTLTFSIGETIKVLKVVGCGSRRGPFAEAKLLYEDLSPEQIKTPYLTNAQKGAPQPHGKPDGRERLKARILSGKE